LRCLRYDHDDSTLRRHQKSQRIVTFDTNTRSILLAELSGGVQQGLHDERRVRRGLQAVSAAELSRVSRRRQSARRRPTTDEMRLETTSLRFLPQPLGIQVFHFISLIYLYICCYLFLLAGLTVYRRLRHVTRQQLHRQSCRTVTGTSGVAKIWR